MSGLVEKYDHLAEGFAEKSYANLKFDMHRRFILAVTWGTPLQSGDSVLELGCGDGYLACLFVRNGFQYLGIDVSPKMIEVAKNRLQSERLNSRFQVADISQLNLSEPYDAIIAYMRTFFAYITDPLTVLKRFHPFVRKKIIVDLNPRRDMTIWKGMAILKAAGFRKVTWRPLFVPKEKSLPNWLLKVLVACEDIPLVRSVPLRWKFHCLLKGEP